MNFKNRFTVKVILLALLSSISTSTFANLLIYPIRISFDETERSATLTLSNTSSNVNTYRLEWREKRALKERGYVELSKSELETWPKASEMIRFSPRQVTLKPGERQLIKLSLRRPRNLAEGEYRSHLLFKAIRPETEKEEPSTSTNININLSFSIPVTVQQGEYDSKVELKNTTIQYNPIDGSRKVSLDLIRKGLHSASGDLSAYWTAEGKDEILLAKVADYNFWSELNEGNVELISTNEMFAPATGKLRIHYEGVRDFDGKTYLNEEVQVVRDDIIISK